MNWKFSYLLIFLFCYSCVSNRNLSETDLLEIVRKTVYKKKYKNLEKYLILEQGDILPSRIIETEVYYKLDICMRMVNWIDTVQIDYWEEGKCLRRCAIVGSQFETISEEGKTLRRLVKEGQVYDWLCSSSNLDYFISVDSPQITQIQKFLKKEKWYSGKVNGQWDLDLFKAIRFYDTFIIKSDFYDLFVELPQAVEQNVLYSMKIIDTIIPRGRGIQKRLVETIQKKLLEKGYNVEVNNVMDKKLKAALIQFQKENKLPQGQLDFETLNALGIKF